MSAISGFLNTIRNAVYGYQVREAIASGIEQCYSDVNSPSLQTAAFSTALNEAYADGILDIQTVTQISAMTNQNIIYRYNGTQAGYNKGLYYYSPYRSAWTLIGSEIQQVSAVSQMTDTRALYYFTGTATGYVTNALHVYNGSVWVPVGSGVLIASTAAQMTNQSAIYKYTGTETGYVQNSLYYYNGTAFVQISEGITVDATLSVQGTPADAKAVGDAIDEVNSDISDLAEQIGSVGLNDAAIYLLTTLFENALYKADMSAEVEQVGDALKGVEGVSKDGTELTISYLLNDTASSAGNILSIT